MAWRKNINDSDEKKALLLAAAEKGELSAFKEAVLRLYKGKKLLQALVSARDQHGNGPLHYAAAAGSNAICCYLIAFRSINPNLSSHRGVFWENTNNMHAASNGHAGTINYLIERGADLHERANDGFTAVHNATIQGEHKALRALVSKGGPVDAEHLKGAPLLLAAYCGDAASMKILLEFNANPNILCEFISPLVLCVTKDSKQCVEVLKLGQLPPEIAAAKGKKEIVDILFPLTSGRPEWIEGLFPYVESENYKKEWQALSKRRIESLKNEIKNALHRREYFGTSMFSEFATNEDPTDSIAKTIHTLCWMRFSRAKVATSITVNLPDHCPCSNNAGLVSLTDSECEEALFALIEGQLSAPILEKIMTSKMEKLTLSR